MPIKHFLNRFNVDFWGRLGGVTRWLDHGALYQKEMKDCISPENTHLLRKGKYHCTADLLFDWFGFSCFVELKL